MVLDDIQFNKWLYNFFPTFEKTKFNNIITPPEVIDPTDPGIGHLIGLMFHRSWTLKEIAAKINNREDKRLLQSIARNHSDKGYNIMFDSGYGGEHWLATFAIYNFTK